MRLFRVTEDVAEEALGQSRCYDASGRVEERVKSCNGRS